MSHAFIRFALTGVLTLAAGAVQADCYDVFGCSDHNIFRATDLANGPTCEFLYMMRNSIYKQRGYCFTTSRAIAMFGNAGCLHDSVRDAPLNRVEQANVATILSVERAKGCPR